MTKNQINSEDVGSAFDLLKPSFEIVKRNWIAFTAVNILSLISTVIFIFYKFDYASKDIEGYLAPEGVVLDNRLALFILITLILFVISYYLFVMRTVLQVESTAGKKPSLGHLFEKAKKYWLRLLGVIIITGVIIVTGLILLIIPGIIAIGRLALAPYFMIDKDMGVIEAIKASNEVGKKYFWKVLAAVGVMFLIGIGAALLDVVPVIGTLLGTLITIAFSLVVPLRYQQLKKLG
ncbi:hypothetical protein KY385_02365 [Candidatus Parcubacteria bacterium]|nr:hypothetical protein [Candidatus Parcubacteria bacterium]